MNARLEVFLKNVAWPIAKQMLKAAAREALEEFVRRSRSRIENWMDDKKGRSSE